MGSIYDLPGKPAPRPAETRLTARQRWRLFWRRLGLRLGVALALVALAFTAHLVWRARTRVASGADGDIPLLLERRGNAAGPEASEAFAQVRQAYQDLQSGRRAEAERALAAVLERDPEYDPALRLLGLVYLQRGRLNDARAVFTRALQHPATRAETLNNLATVLMRQDALVPAEKALLSALAIVPDHPGANLNLGVLYLSWKQYDLAAVRLEAARAALPGHPGLLNNLAVCRLRAGQTASARALLLQAATNGPPAAPTLFNLAITHALETNAPEALVWIRQARARCTAAEASAALADPDFEPIRRTTAFLEFSAALHAEESATGSDTGGPATR